MLLIRIDYIILNLRCISIYFITVKYVVSFTYHAIICVFQGKFVRK